ncbi:MAG: hypothetical protein REI78_08030 [Pedobacter sp.]|nr:hypothetical protein [Pedobacter sp.]
MVVYFGQIVLNVACGPEQDPYDTFVSYFHNDLAGDRYANFLFNDWMFLYNDEEIADEAEINSKEWSEYLKVAPNDVRKVMYEADSLTELKLANLQKFRLKDFSKEWQQNTFLSALYANQQVAKYFRAAKSCEPYVTSDYDSWDPAARDSSMMIKKAKEVAKLAIAEQDPFLKLRYGYQVVRLYHYAHNFQDCMSAYQQLVLPNPTKSAAQGWAMAAYAGAMRHSGHQNEAAYLFSKVFNANPERRIKSYKNYYYINPSIENVLRYAKNDEERANIWAIHGFGNPLPDLKNLQRVYQYLPESEMVGTLLVREVNKLEQSLIRDGGMENINYTAYYSGSAEEVAARKKNQLHLNEVRNFALQLADEKKYPQPALGTLAAAYLMWLAHNDTLALSYLERLDPNRLPERLKDQYRIIELLIKANRIKNGNPINEQKLLPALKWLDSKKFAEFRKLKADSLKYKDFYWSPASKNFFTTTRNLYQQILAPAYLKLGDTAKAALAMMKGDQEDPNYRMKAIDEGSFATIAFNQQALGPKTMLRLLKLKKMSKKETLESFLAQNLKSLDMDSFYRLYATAFIRSHAYDQALWCFSQLKDKKEYFLPSDGDDVPLASNPFRTTINDYPKQYVSQGGYSAVEFCRKMVQLQKLIKTDPKNAAKYYFEMANGVYQTSHYGNGWYFISYIWNADELSRPIKYPFQLDYRQAKTAKAWYLKARSLSHDAEFRAKCTFMLAKCEQKRMSNLLFSNPQSPIWSWEYDSNQYLAMNQSNPYFKELKLDYAKTKFFKTAVGECSYLRDFIAGRKFAIKERN